MLYVTFTSKRISLKLIHLFFFLLKDADLLEVESKHFEDLEFQQLENESRLDEEKENLTQQLLREVAEYQRSIVSRKVIFFKKKKKIRSLSLNNLVECQLIAVVILNNN